MKLKKSLLLTTIILVMLLLMASTGFADESDYGTMTWITRDGKARVTLTGIVGVQLDETTTDVAWMEDYGDNTLLSLDYDNTLSSFEKIENNNIIPIVDGATLTIELINGGYIGVFAKTEFSAASVRDRMNLYEAKIYGDDVFTYTYRCEEGKSFVTKFLHGVNCPTYLYYDQLIYTKVVSDNDAKALLAKKKAEIDSGVGYESASSWAVKELQAANTQYMSADSMSNNFKNNTTRKEFCQLVIQLPKLLASQIEYDEQLAVDSSNIRKAVRDGDLLTLTDSQILKYSIGEFEDVSYTAYDIINAAKYGIINGYVKNGMPYFNPNGDITREALCTMIVRALKVSGVNLDTSVSYAGTYSDLSEISSWAEENMRILNGYGIYKGNGTQLMPKKTVDRQTAILLCYRAFKAFSGEILDGKYNTAFDDYIVGRLDQPYVRVEAEDMPEGINVFENSFSLATGDYIVREGNFVLDNAPTAEQVTISYVRSSELRGLSSAYDGLMGVSINGEITPVRFPVTGNSDETIGEITLTVNLEEGDTFSIVNIPNGEAISIDYVDFYTTSSTIGEVSEGYDSGVGKEVSILSAVAKPAGSYVRYEAEHEANKYGGLSSIVDSIYLDRCFVQGIFTEGAYISFANCPASETMTICYDNIADDDGDAVLSVYVNGKKLAIVSLLNTTEFNTFEETTVNLSIPESATVALQWDFGDAGSIAVDFIDFYGEGLLAQDDVYVKEEPEVADNSGLTDTVIDGKVLIVANINENGTKIEAESTKNIIVGNTSTESISGGGKALSYFERQDESITFTDCPSANSMTVRYSARSYFLEDIMLYVDDELIGELVFQGTKGYSEYEEITFAVDIKEGADVMIKLEDFGCMGINIDYVEFHD